MPEFFKYASAKLIRNKLIRNYDFLNYYSSLQERNRFISNFTREYQFSQLKKILQYANNNVPYYNKLFKEVKFDPDKMKSFKEINRIPLLTRDDIIENFEQLISTKKIKGGSYVAKTSGTSGSPLEIMHDYKSFFVENAFIYHYRKKLGYEFSDRLVTFRGVEFKKKISKLNPIHNELILSPFKLSAITLDYYLKTIDSFEPDYIHGYLSAIYFFAKFLSERNLKLKKKLKGIFLISENIKQDKRDFIESYFDTKSLTLYGHTERCIIAEEVEANVYQFDPYYGYTEFQKNNDGTMAIIGTGFINQTMPLIRYKTDDSCIKVANGYKIMGKWESDAGIFGKNMELFTHATIPTASSCYNNVIQSQYIQDEIGKAKILIIPTNKFTDHDAKAIVNEIIKRTNGAIELKVEIVDKLILSPRGKLSLFHNTVKNNVLVS